jgi:hypothetical protein
MHGPIQPRESGEPGTVLCNPYLKCRPVTITNITFHSFICELLQLEQAGTVNPTPLQPEQAGTASPMVLKSIVKATNRPGGAGAERLAAGNAREAAAGGAMRHAANNRTVRELPASRASNRRSGRYTNSSSVFE